MSQKECHKTSCGIRGIRALLIRDDSIDRSQAQCFSDDDVDVIKKILQHLDLWETRNHDPPPGKVLLKFIPENELHSEQLTMACNLQYPDLDSNRYEDDYSTATG